MEHEGKTFERELFKQSGKRDEADQLPAARTASVGADREPTAEPHKEHADGATAGAGVSEPSTR